MTALLRHLAGNQLGGFILVLARVTPLFIVAPLFSSALIPPRSGACWRSASRSG